MKIKILALFALLIISVNAQNDTIMYFEDYDPPSTLVVPEHIVTQAKYPFIDVHNHQWNYTEEYFSELLKKMDSLNMAYMVNLSGRGFRRLEGGGFALQEPAYMTDAIKMVNEKFDSRIIFFTNVDFNNIDETGWTDKAVAQLEEDVKNGAKGLKIYKGLGMGTQDSKGNRVAVDDARIDPVWAKCGELGIPVLIHTADPAQFWQPMDKNNERWLELKTHPGRYRDPAANPSFEQLITEQHNVFRKHPGTKFINAHLGWLGQDLGRLGKLLDELPNVYTEIGAVLYEIGRQPRFAREFFIKHQDRIMMGKDSWRPEEYHSYFRVLETADEYFDYYRRYHAFWKLYGVDLPDEVLKKVYYKNALNVIPGIDKSKFPD
ncbi:MAG: amidohydrolase family protein [Ignavibacteriaceae bacterium]